MKLLLTQAQAEAVASAISALAAAGGRAARIAFPVGICQIRIRCPISGAVVVRLIDDKNKTVATRTYTCLGRFVSEHAEAR